jgi:hypothetical protein
MRRGDRPWRFNMLRKKRFAAGLSLRFLYEDVDDIVILVYRTP